jgi:hypothetical protein
MSPHTSIAPADATDTRFRDTTSPSQEPPCCELGARSASAVTAPGSLSSGVTPSGLWPPRRRRCMLMTRHEKRQAHVQQRSAAVCRGAGQAQAAGITWHGRQIPKLSINTRASGGASLRDGPRTARTVKSPGKWGIPSRRHQRHSGPLRGKLADATGYPLSAPPVLRQANTHRAISVPLTPVNHGQ